MTDCIILIGNENKIGLTMKLFSLICGLSLMLGCSMAVANIAALSSVEKDPVKCIKYQPDKTKDYFHSFLKRQYKQVNALEGKITKDNLLELRHALQQFQMYWVELKQASYQACQQHANCTQLQQQYLRTTERQPRNRANVNYRQNKMCQKSEFEYAISRVKMVSFYNDVERLELISQK